MADITDAELQQLRELEQAATETPWAVGGRAQDADAGVVAGGRNIWQGRWATDITSPGADLSDADAKLIAAARNALPRLLDEVERLRKRNALLEGKLQAERNAHKGTREGWQILRDDALRSAGIPQDTPLLKVFAEMILMRRCKEWLTEQGDYLLHIMAGDDCAMCTGGRTCVVHGELSNG